MDDCSKLRCHFQCQSNICCPMAAAPFRWLLPRSGWLLPRSGWLLPRSDGCMRSSISGANIIFIEIPCELSNAYALLISRSDTQCFSHEDGCFAPVTKCKRSPSELVRDVHTLIIVAAGNELLSSPSELLQDLLHGNGSRLRDKFSSIEDQLVPLLEAGVTARGDDPALALYHDYICLAGNVEVADPPAYVGMLTF